MKRWILILKIIWDDIGEWVHCFMHGHDWMVTRHPVTLERYSRICGRCLKRQRCKEEWYDDQDD